MNIVFTQIGWNEYLYWHTQDRKTVKKINKLIKSIESKGASNGEGHPEYLKYIKAYSRHIDEKNRLVYQVSKTDIIVLSCKGHYEN